MSNNENKSITPLRKYIAIGYAVIALLIGGIVFIYLHEWRELERIEAESKEINILRKNVLDAYAQMLDLTLYGEKVLEWNAEDTLVYRGKRLAMDSILCEFKQYYIALRDLIASLRYYRHACCQLFFRLTTCQSPNRKTSQ